MAKTEEVPMVRMVNVTTGQPVSVRADKVARMTADWRVDEGDDAKAAKAAAKAEADAAKAAAKAEADAAKAAAATPS